MKHAKQLVKLTTLSVLLSLAAIFANTLADEAEWGYTGDEGPEHWSEMSSEFALCAEGTAQSPIDISDAAEVDLVAIEFHYGATGSSIVNNGHTIQSNVDPGSLIVYNGISYDLLQFHFHSPSEHTIDGEAAAMEGHFVHQDPKSGMLAVVGILLRESDQDNEAYAAIFDHMPAQAGEEMAMSEVISLMALLPDQRTYYTYQGSLTTPPCSEIVRWLLLDTAVDLSATQIAAFTEMYAYNARPTLPLGKRDLLLDSR